MASDQGSDYHDADSIDYAALSPRSEADVEQTGSGRKKRKAWGQPIPDFEKIIGPRKRAKTEAERTQRAHERTLRNRRAAAQSRDKKQAQFAAMEKENQTLREQLAQYQARFGALQGDSKTPGSLAMPPMCSVDVISSPSPSTETTFEHEHAPVELAPPTPTASVSDPVLSQDTPVIPQLDISPTLAPSLQLDSHPIEDNLVFHQMPSPAMSGDFTEATQYSAAVLVDPQCHASVKSRSLGQHLNADRFLDFNFQLINLTILMTIFENFSSSMLTPMYRIFRILAGDFSMPSVKPEDLDQHFQLIHCLIMSPMRGTVRPVFRMKLLSRLLACNPITARLITVAADRALQRQVAEDSSLEDPESCQKWASLLTLRWTIQWLEKEHARYREARRIGCSLPRPTSAKSASVRDEQRSQQGVDYRAIERSWWRWDGVELAEMPMVL